MPELETFQCPNCGGPLSIRDPMRAKMVVCPACGSCLSKTAAGLAGEGKLDTGAHPPRGPVQLGRWIKLGDRPHEVIGRIRYGGDAWNWDEWLLRSDIGQHLWLAEDGQRYVLFRGFQPKDPIAVDGLHVHQRVPLDEHEATVTEVEDVQVLHFEGELTWKAEIGETIRYADLRVDDLHYSIEASPEEIRFFKGRVVPPAKIRAMFGRMGAEENAGDVTWRDYAPTSEGFMPGLLWAGFALFLFYLLAVRGVEAGAKRFPAGAGDRTMSVRQGSVYTVRGYWGGYHGGK